MDFDRCLLEDVFPHRTMLIPIVLQQAAFPLLPHSASILVTIPLSFWNHAIAAVRAWTLGPYKVAVPMVHNDESGAKGKPVRRESAAR